MSSHKDKAFVDDLRQRLDRHADNLDELTSARLRAMRKRALDQTVRPYFSWLPLGGLAAGAVAVLAVVLWTIAPQAPPGFPGDLELLAQVEDLELIEELEFYVWLEETEPSG